jgi:hypothetical protein
LAPKSLTQADPVILDASGNPVRPAVAGFIRLLCDLWPGSKRNAPGTIAVYATRMMALDDRDTAKAIGRLSERCRDWPSWSEIAEAADEARRERLDAEVSGSLPDPSARRTPESRRMVDAYRAAFSDYLGGRIGRLEWIRRCRQVDLAHGGDGSTYDAMLAADPEDRDFGSGTLARSVRLASSGIGVVR